jgi:hypothetical protein
MADLRPQLLSEGSMNTLYDQPHDDPVLLEEITAAKIAS